MRHYTAGLLANANLFLVSFVDIQSVLDICLKVVSISATSYTTYLVYKDKKGKKIQEKNRGKAKKSRNFAHYPKKVNG